MADLIVLAGGVGIEMAAKKAGSRKGRVRQEEYRAVQQFWPTRDRRAFFQNAIGFQMPIYNGAVQYVKRTRGSVQIYIDVSGSMIGYRGDILRGVLSCRREIEPEVFLFSTEVVPIPLEELRQGVFQSTGGTDLGCVFQHLWKTLPAGVVILTDGYVGSISNAAKERLNDCSIQVVLTPNGYTEDLQKIADGFHYFYGAQK